MNHKMMTSAHAESSRHERFNPSTVDINLNRRADCRYTFTADIEIESDRGCLFKGRVANLSLGGCYVEAESSLQITDTVKIRIEKSSDTLEAEATVAYVSPHDGMGLMFTVMTPPNLALLIAWISPNLGKSWLVSSCRD